MAKGLLSSTLIVGMKEELKTNKSTSKKICILFGQSLIFTTLT